MPPVPALISTAFPPPDRYSIALLSYSMLACREPIASSLLENETMTSKLSPSVMSASVDKDSEPLAAKAGI